MKYDELNLQKIREVPIFDVCSKLGISLYGMGQITKRATCWYHDDQHPSMHVNPKKNIYKCFVCGKGGDVIKLVQDYENKSFIEACDWLVNEFHIVLIEEPRKRGTTETREQESVDSSIPNSVNPMQSLVEKKTSAFSPLPSDIVQRSLSVDSQFCKSVVSTGYLSEGQLRHAAACYRLGVSKDGGVIFWEIDDQQRVHTGKIMYYQSDCHRDKQHTPTWVHSLMKDKLPENYELQHCLFGLHLLTSDLSHQPSDFSPQPSDLSHQPSAISPLTSALSPQPSYFSPQPSALLLQPSDFSHQPSTLRLPNLSFPNSQIAHPLSFRESIKALTSFSAS